MAEEVRPDETIFDDHTGHQTSENPTPSDNQNTATPKPHSVPKAKKEAPAWLQAVGGFFRALFVTPWALMQKVFLRIAGGKKMVEETEKQLVEELKEQKVRQAEIDRSKFLEREINDLLQKRLQDPAYTSDGLYISSVSINPNITGDDSILSSITVACNNGKQDAGEYQMHMSQDGRILYNAIVPHELQLQLQELIKSVSLTASNPEVSDYDEHFFDEPVDDQPEQSPVQVYTAHNDTRNPHERKGLDVTVKRWTEDVQNGDVTVSVSKAKLQVIDTKGTRQSYDVDLVGGHLQVHNLPQHIASNATVAKTIYQAFQPLLQHNQTLSAQHEGVSREALHESALQDAFRHVHTSALNHMNSAKDTLQQYFAQCEAAPETTTPDVLPKPSTSMFIIPNLDGTITVVNENVSLYNKDKEHNPVVTPNKRDFVHLNAYFLDTNNPETCAFKTVLQPAKDKQGREIIDEKTKEPQQERVTQIIHQTVSAQHTDRTLDVRIAQFYHAATQCQVMPVTSPEGLMTHQFMTCSDNHASPPNNPGDITCVKAIATHEGFVLESEQHLNQSQIQEFTQLLHRDGDPTTFSTETRASAAEVLNKAAQFAQQGKRFTRYFVMGDVAMSYDGNTLSMQRPGDDKPVEFAINKLDAESIEAAYSEYYAQNRDTYEHDIITEDEVEETL